MSQLTWIFSAGSEDSPSQHSGQDSGQSGSAKSRSTARKCSPNTSLPKLWPTPSSNEFRTMDAQKLLERREKCRQTAQNGNGFGLTLGNAVTLMGTYGTSTEETSQASPSSQVDFLASLSASPGSDEARQMTVRSGLKCSELSRKQDPLGFLERTLLASSQWNSTLCYLTWRHSATPQGRLLFQLAVSMPGTGETGSGLWRTPGASETTGGAANAEDRKAQNHAISLSDQVNTPSIWPTPSAREWKGARKPETLEAAGRNETNSLSDAVAHVHGLKNPSGSLNPAWVEWLMGYPTGWTDLKDSATPLSRKSHIKF